MLICKRYNDSGEQAPETQMVDTNSANKVYVQPKRRKLIKTSKGKRQKSIIKGVSPNRKADDDLGCYEERKIKSRRKINLDPNTMTKDIGIAEESKSNPKEELSPQTEHKALRVGITGAKNKSSFSRNHRQELGLTWLDQLSSSDSQ